LKAGYQDAPEGINATGAAEKFAFEVHENCSASLFGIVETAFERAEEGGFSELAPAIDEARAPSPHIS
jgi:hypothetical protein